jgi:Zn-finger nucleic acid-binding protein
MIGVALSDRVGIDVDVCQHCHFIWFDAHEVNTLVPRQPEPVAPKLPQRAREVLAIAEVERLSKQAEGADFDSAAPDESWKQIAAFLGMPVQFDTPEEQRRPWVTWLLSAAIICASLVAFSNRREVVQRFGLIPRRRRDSTVLHSSRRFSFTQASFILPGTCISCWPLAMSWKIFCDHWAISHSLHWQHSSVTWHISLLILARTHLASAPAAALLPSLRFTH